MKKVEKDRSMPRRKSNASLKVEDWENKSKVEQYESTNAGWGRIFSNYKP